MDIPASGLPDYVCRVFGSDSGSRHYFYPSGGTGNEFFEHGYAFFGRGLLPGREDAVATEVYKLLKYLEWVCGDIERAVEGERFAQRVCDIYCLGNECGVERAIMSQSSGHNADRTGFTGRYNVLERDSGGKTVQDETFGFVGTDQYIHPASALGKLSG